MTDIAWTTEQRKLSNLAPWDKNPRKLSDHDADQLRQSIERFGLADPLIVNTDGQLIGGHQRKKILVMMDVYGPDAEVDVRVPSRTLAGTELAELNIRLNRNAGEWDWDVLTSEFELESLKGWGFTELELGVGEFVRPDFSSLLEELDVGDVGGSSKDGNWFYVEFYGDDSRFHELSELMSGWLPTKHEMEREFFYRMVKGYATGEMGKD